MGLVDIVNLPMLYIKRENLSEWKNKKKKQMGNKRPSQQGDEYEKWCKL